jgi:hypothetical protein
VTFASGWASRGDHCNVEPSLKTEHFLRGTFNGFWDKAVLSGSGGLMSFREKIDAHPFFWLISALTTGFLAALPVIAKVMEFTGTETVRSRAIIN